MQRQARLQQGLFKDKVVSQDALDAADSRVRWHRQRIDQDKAALKMQEANLEFTEIRAPFDGVVVKKMAEVGESVAPIPPGVNISTSSGAIVAIADMNSLEAEVDVNEANVGELDPGYPADITVQAIPDHTYKGVLRQVIPDRRPHQGDGDGEGVDPRQRPSDQAGDELQRHVPGAAEEGRQKEAVAHASSPFPRTLSLRATASMWCM